MSSGWIKVYRKIIEWQWYDDANTFRLFMHLLLKANSKDAIWRGTPIKRGQLITSIAHLSEELKLSTKKIRISIDKLKRTGEVASKRANNSTLIIICNYDNYQSIENERGQEIGQTKGKQRANEGQQTRIKEEKNIRNIKSFDLSFINEEFRDVFLEWLDYKKQSNDSYKVQKSVELAYNKLLALSENNLDNAKKIVENSMSNNYKGLFPLKQRYNIEEHGRHREVSPMPGGIKGISTL